MKLHRYRLARIAFPIVVAAALGAAFVFGDWLTLARLAESRDQLLALVEARPRTSLAVFFLGVVAATSICFPAAPIVGVAAGALFGFWPGFLVVLAGSSIGSTVAFFASRGLLREWVKDRFAARLAAIDRGFERHGPFYLLALRFNPLIPYWLVNLAMGVTAMRARTYYPLTVVGLSPATFIYVTAGTQLARIERASDILSMELFAALLVLSLFPLIVDRLTSRLRGDPET